jgi:hypothetical protein
VVEWGESTPPRMYAAAEPSYQFTIRIKVVRWALQGAGSNPARDKDVRPQ